MISGEDISSGAPETGVVQPTSSHNARILEKSRVTIFINEIYSA